MSERRERIVELRNKGYTYQEIADIEGVSKQRIAQICGKPDPNYFKIIREDACIYPKWRAWMNENKVSRNEFLLRLGLSQHARNSAALSGWMRGRCFPIKRTIDKILEVTGLTYEELFYRNDT